MDGDGPGTAFVFTYSKEGDQAEQLVALADETAQSALYQAIGRKKFGRLLVAHLRQLGLDFTADGGGPSVGPRGHLFQLVSRYGGFQGGAQRRALRDIEHKEHRFLGEEHEAANQLLLLRRHLHLAQRLLLLQLLLATQEQGVLFFEVRRTHLLQIFLQPLQALFHLGKIGEDEVEVDILDIAQRVNAADAGNGVVFKRAQHMDQRVVVAQVSEEGALLERFLAHGSYVRVLHRGIDDF